jgi:hypothetical protein
MGHRSPEAVVGEGLTGVETRRRGSDVVVFVEVTDQEVVHRARAFDAD